jgi:guanine deaminase
MSSVRHGYRAAVLTPRDAGGLTYIEDGLLVVDGAGKIERVEAFRPEVAGGMFVHDLQRALLVPGFVDAHVHYPQTRVIGSASGPLLEWLQATVFPEEARFSSESYAREVAVDFCRACAAAGTTTVAAYSSSHERATEILFDTLEEAGLRGYVGLTLMERACPRELAVPLAEAERAVRALAKSRHGSAGGRLRLAVTPRFALSCTRELLEAAARLASELELLVQTHVAEHPREAEETLALHPYAADYLGVYEAAGLVGPRTIFAHAIHLSESEWDRVAARGAAIAHCPDSNAFLGSGRMRLGEARRRGIAVGLGSDVAAGRSFDMRRALSHAYDAALATGAPAGAAELFELATLGGARALHLADVAGALTAGRDADFVVLHRPAHAAGEDGALRIATFAADVAPVLRTYVRGRLVWQRDAAF